MIEKSGILCEILFVDDKSGAPTISIGRLEGYQLKDFNEENQSNFISFIESYIPPVLKVNIKKITMYDDDEGIPYSVENGKLKFTVIDSNIAKIRAKVS